MFGYLIVLISLSITLSQAINSLYPNLGETLTLRCQQSGQYFCYSTYTFKNQLHPMIIINSTLKYSTTFGSLTINNIDRTDAGFYACSSTCTNMKADLIDFYVQPMQNQQPINVNEFFLAIPPVDPNFLLNENYFVPFGQSKIMVPHRHELNGGEIAGIVIGGVAFLLIIILIIAFIIWSKTAEKNKSKRKREKDYRPEEQQSETTSVDYTTVEKEFGSKHDTYKSDKVLINDDRKRQQKQTVEDDQLPNIQIGSSKQNSYSSANNVIPDIVAPKARQKQTQQENSYEAILNPLREEPKNGKFYSDNRIPPKLNLNQAERESDESTGSRQIQIERSQKKQSPTGSNNSGNNLPVKYQKSASYGPQKILDDANGIKNIPIQTMPKTSLDYSDASDSSRQQVPFKSLVRSQKKSLDASSPQQQGSAPSTSRSYQGPSNLYQQQQQTTTSKFQQITTRQQMIIDKRQDSLQIKDSATDV